MPDAMVYLSNWSVLEAGAPVVWPGDPTGVSHIESGRASSTGAYSLPYSGRPGPSVVWTPNSSSEGGGFATVNLTGYDATANLILYPYVAEGNASFVLPAWNNLSAYA